jgi:hypothetical protein
LFTYGWLTMGLTKDPNERDVRRMPAAIQRRGALLTASVA